MIEESLYSVLSAIAPTFPMVAEDDQQAPYITYHAISNTPEVTLADGIPINNTRIQIDAYAKTYAGMKTLAQQIQAAMAAAPFTNVQQQSQDLYEAPVKLYRYQVDFSVWY